MTPLKTTQVQLEEDKKNQFIGAVSGGQSVHLAAKKYGIHKSMAHGAQSLFVTLSIFVWLFPLPCLVVTFATHNHVSVLFVGQIVQSSLKCL